MTTGAAFARHSSKQDYATPADFIVAVQRRFGNFSWDLAASPENTKAPCWITEELNSFGVEWHKLGGLLWLNPEFNTIAPWAKKCAEESALGADILLLVPAAVGSNWFADYVDKKAFVHFLRPRLCFDGKNPYPKDCLLARFSKHRFHGYECWKWK